MNPEQNYVCVCLCLNVDDIQTMIEREISSNAFLFILRLFFLHKCVMDVSR